MALKKYDAKDIRNVVLLSHGHAGKTTLAEAILYDCKATTRLGSVDDDTSVLMYEPEEQKRKATMATKIAWVEWKKTKINLIDTPGDSNFFHDTRLGIQAASCGLVLVSAVDGVQVGTEQVYALADEAGLPRVVLVNKLDRERADFDSALDEIKKTLSSAAVPFQLPYGKEAQFSGVIDLLSMKLVKSEGDGREVTAGDIPADAKDAAGKAREALVEAIAAADDDLLAKFLETMELSEDEIKAGLAKAIQGKTVVPVLCASASANIGVQPLLDFIVNQLPAPSARGAWEGKDGKGNPVKREPSESEPFSGFVFKTSAADIGRMCYVRIVSGKLSGDLTLVNPKRNGANERPGTLYALIGNKRDTTPEAAAGDIVALAKLKDTHTGDTLCDLRGELTFDLPEPPSPVISFALRSKSKGDEDKLASKLHEILDYDPSLRLDRDLVSKEILLSGMGNIHIEANVERLRRMGVDVELLPPKVPYKETIKGRVQHVEGKHKKQTGGKGQFGVCFIDMEPAPRGDGFVFVDGIVGGAIPRQFIPSVEKGMKERMTRGVIAGFPVVDVKVTLKDGKYHDVDSDSRSFEFAGSKAFRAAFLQCKPVLLEPVMKVEITCPEEFMGNIMGDVNQRRGRVQGSDARGRNQVIKAQIPMSETLKYAADLRSLTGGRGTFTMAFDHYDEVPAHQTEKIIAEAKLVEEED